VGLRLRIQRLNEAIDAVMEGVNELKLREKHRDTTKRRN
jgi:hypothetical protein